MRASSIFVFASAISAAPAVACPFDDMYGGHRFSSLMSEYQRPADSSSDSSASDAAYQGGQDQQGSGSAEQPAAATQPSYGQGEPTYR